MVKIVFARYCFLFFFFLLFSFGVKSQTTYYVNDHSRAGDSYSQSPGNDHKQGTAAAPFATISHAISVANSGDIIYVDAGTFTEQLEINKQLSIVGAGIGITNINSPGMLSLSYTIPPNTTVHRPIVYVHDAAGVVIKNITVNGLGNGNANNRLQGIAYRNAGGTVQDCEVKAIRNNPMDGVQAGVAIYANANNGTARTLNLIHNLLTDYQKNATVLAGNNLTINVANNTVIGSGPLDFTVQNGFQVSDGASGTITNNAISNISYISSTVVAAGILVFGPGSIQTSGNAIKDVQAGIYYSGSGGSISNNMVSNTVAGMGATPYWYSITVEDGNYSVTGNEINGEGNGAGIEADAYEGHVTTMIATNNSVMNMDEGFVIAKYGLGAVNANNTNNSITGSTNKAIHNYGSTTSDVNCNWYGTTDGAAIASKITGPVTYTSFSTNGTDIQPGTPGFQPASGSCGSTTCTNDVTAPIITLKSNPTVFLTSANTYTVQLSDVLQSVTDNCDPNPGATVSTLNISCNSPASGSGGASHQAYVANSSTGNQVFQGELGMDFRVNAANGIVITQLGAFDHQGNGIIGTQPDGNGGFGIRVAIFNKATQAIVPGLSTVITGGGDVYSGYYRYKNIPAVTLPKGDYIVIAKGYNAAELEGNSQVGGGPYPQGDNAGGAITYLNSGYYGADNPSGFNYPTGSANTGTSSIYKAGTFNYSLSQGNTITVTATDVAGNRSQASTTVSVVNTAYVLTTKDITVALNSSGQATIQPADVLQSLKNSCGIDITTSTLKVSPSSFDCSSIGGGGGVTPSTTSYYPFVANSSTGNQSFHGELGMDFRVNAAGGIVINQLGAFDHQGNGILGTQPDGNGNYGIRVAIFSKATQAIVPGLSTVIVGNGDSYSGNYRYKNIPAVTLPQGDYIVIAKGYNGNELVGNSYAGGSPYPAGDNAGGAITYLNYAYYGPDNALGFSYPAGAINVGTSSIYKAGTFVYKTLATGGSAATLNGGTSYQPFVANSSTGNQSFHGELGMDFRVNAAGGIVINQLGAFDHQGNGILGTQPDGNGNYGIRVAIFSKATQAIVPGLSTVIVGNGDSYSGNYRYKNIPAVTLPTGDYIVVAKGYNGNELEGNSYAGGSPYPAGDNAGGAITYLNSAYYGADNSSGFSYPSGSLNVGTSSIYKAGTFTYALSQGNTNTSNNKTVTITATDIYGNVTTATATVTITNPSGSCSSTPIVAYVANTSIASVQTTDASVPVVLDNITKALKVYPNPSNGQFTVQLVDVKGAKVTLQIADASGQVIEQKTVPLTGKMPSLAIPVDISKHATGIYVIKVISTDGIQTAKVVVSH